ncbi:RHS repeat-associated core domain-containing protein [Nonlabens sp. SY33080]|uniref:RHS repeat-associated core domain-containing protein n=1 Tax=Nonlabens sp. SY33080 TaxID=2719911 RepID=UPI001428C91A|nr:RHS repeat-associated core domain-containing protein [Nonlabens sp. SY33080]
MNNTLTSTTSYAGAFIYEKSSSGGSEQLHFFSHAEGYVEKVDQVYYKYVYQYKGHLDNIRLSYQDMNNNGNVDSSEIKEENNYYPFGLEHKGYNNVVQNSNSTASKFKFQGVEHEEALGLDLYEMDWKSYDPALGRFITIDPMAEERNWLTPYNFVQNNPILRVDPSGLLDDDGEVDDIVEEGIANGFIHTKRNYKKRNNVFNVNGTDEPSLKEFDHFQEVMSRIIGVESSSFGLGKEIINEDNEVIGQDIQAVILNKYEGNTDIEAKTTVKTIFDTYSFPKNGVLLTHNYLTATHTHRYTPRDNRPGANDVWDPSDIDRSTSRKQTGLIQYIISGGRKQKFTISN